MLKGRGFNNIINEIYYKRRGRGYNNFRSYESHFTSTKEANMQIRNILMKRKLMKNLFGASNR